MSWKSEQEEAIEEAELRSLIVVLFKHDEIGLQVAEALFNDGDVTNRILANRLRLEEATVDAARRRVRRRLTVVLAKGITHTS